MPAKETANHSYPSLCKEAAAKTREAFRGLCTRAFSPTLKKKEGGLRKAVVDSEGKLLDLVNREDVARSLV